MADIQKSIQKTIDFLRSNISAQGKKELKVTGKEVLAKMSRDWFATNIKSIKKLEQDIDLLEQHAQKRVLKSSKIGAMAAEYHELKKKASATLKATSATLDISRKLTADPQIRKLIPGMEVEVKALERTVSSSQTTRDNITNEAAKMRKEARKIIKVDVPRLRRVAVSIKEHRHDIGWMAYPIKFLPAGLDLLVGGAEVGNTLGDVADQTESLVELGTGAGETLVDIAETLNDRFKVLERASK